MDTSKKKKPLIIKHNEHKNASTVHRPLTGSYHNLSELAVILFSKPEKTFLTDNNTSPPKQMKWLDHPLIPTKYIVEQAKTVQIKYSISFYP